MPIYNSLNEGDPKKSYQSLWDIVRRHIQRQTENKIFLEKEKVVKNMSNIFQGLKPSGPIPKVKVVPNESKKKSKPTGGTGETEEVIPVKPKSNLKKHPEDKKGKD